MGKKVVKEQDPQGQVANLRKRIKALEITNAAGQLSDLWNHYTECEERCSRIGQLANENDLMFRQGLARQSETITALRNAVTVHRWLIAATIIGVILREVLR